MNAVHCVEIKSKVMVHWHTDSSETITLTPKFDQKV